MLSGIIPAETARIAALKGKGKNAVRLELRERWLRSFGMEPP
jgi:hypothetical protein